MCRCCHGISKKNKIGPVEDKASKLRMIKLIVFKFVYLEIYNRLISASQKVIYVLFRTNFSKGQLKHTSRNRNTSFE